MVAKWCWLFPILVMVCMWAMEKARYRSKGLNLLKGEDGKVYEEEDFGRIGRMYVVIICLLC
jgi:hypothetical protein